MKVVYRFALITFGFTIIICLLLAIGLNWDILFSWLLAISVVTFLSYGYDKSIAGSETHAHPRKNPPGADFPRWHTWRDPRDDRLSPQDR